MPMRRLSPARTALRLAAIVGLRRLSFVWGALGLAAVAGLLGCGSPTTQQAQPAELGAYLGAITTDHAASEVASWRLDEAAWRRIVVEPYRGLHADYAREFDRLAPALAASLGRGDVADREHFAGDPELTQDQAVARWAVPPLFPSRVATAGGAPLDVVFLRDGGRWRAIAGLGAIVHRHAVDLDLVANTRCSGLFAVERPHRELTKACRDATWPIADALLRSDRDRATRACKLAVNVCGKRSPP
jgi:hypothetical protein